MIVRSKRLLVYGQPSGYQPENPALIRDFQFPIEDIVELEGIQADILRAIAAIPAGGAPTGFAGGDLSGFYPNPAVAAILGNAIPANAAGALTNDGAGNLSWVAAGTPSLLSTQIAFGSGANLMTSSASLTFSSGVLSISGRIDTGYAQFTEFASVSTPSAGIGAIWAKSDGHAWYTNSAGVSFDLTQGGGGTVTAISIASANGFAGSSSGGATPILTISTSITGILIGNGTAISAATNADITGKLLTGYVSGAGVVAAGDSILQAIQKLNGNIGALVTGVSSVNALTGAVPLTGTANRITVSAANVFDISANYDALWQPVDADLTTIAGLAVARGAIMVGNSTPAWSILPLSNAGKILRSDGSDLKYSTATFADTYTASNLLYSNGANTVTGLATANTAVLVTDSSGVPSLATTVPATTQINSLSATAQTYRVTNGGANATPLAWWSTSASASGTMGNAVNNGAFAFMAGNGTRQIIRGYITITNLTNTANSEAADMTFNTQSAGGSATEKLRITSVGNIYGSSIHNNAVAPTGATNGYIASGTYTPTLFNTTNVAASTAYVSQWIRVGNVVTVSGKVDIDTTLAASSATELGVSIPIASALATEEQLAGTAASDSIASLVARIKADTVNDRASFVFKSLSITNDSYAYTFTYLVL